MTICTGRIGEHNGFRLGVGEVQPVAEEQRPDERQFLKLLQRDGILQQLPFGLQREELVNKLFGIREEVVVVVFVPKALIGGDTEFDESQLGSSVKGAVS